MNRNSLALLPATMSLFRTRAIHLNKCAQYWDKNVIYVMRNTSTDKVVFFSSAGRFLAPKYAVGTIHQVHHDQTHADQGRFEVLNIIDLVNGEVVSSENTQYLTSKAPIWVFK
jgi:hypothetical protein